MGLERHSYENFDLENIDQFKGLWEQNSNIQGFNVTIPYKEQIMPFLSKIDAEAEAIGAVNTIKINGKQTVGFNTDAYGFQKSIQPHLKEPVVLPRQWRMYLINWEYPIFLSLETPRTNNSITQI